MTMLVSEIIRVRILKNIELTQILAFFISHLLLQMLLGILLGFNSFLWHLPKLLVPDL